MDKHRVGADQGTLVHLYRAPVRSRLDYGCIVYESAANSVLKDVNAIQMEVLRIASGVFRSFPSKSIQVIVNEKPLSMCREYLTLKYYYKMRAQLQNPVYASTIRPEQEPLYRNKRVPPPIAIRIKDLHKYNINTGYLKPAFSYSIYGIAVPTWSITTPTVNTTLAELPREITTAHVYQESFLEIMEEYEA